jgi:hypothetical protein
MGVMLTEITEISSGRKVLNDMPIRFKAVKLSDRFAIFRSKNQSAPATPFCQFRGYGDRSGCAGFGRQNRYFCTGIEHDFRRGAIADEYHTPPGGQSIWASTRP